MTGIAALYAMKWRAPGERSTQTCHRRGTPPLGAVLPLGLSDCRRIQQKGLAGGRFDADRYRSVHRHGLLRLPRLANWLAVGFQGRAEVRAPPGKKERPGIPTEAHTNWLSSLDNTPTGLSVNRRQEAAA
jgi:hypothetical protein